MLIRQQAPPASSPVARKHAQRGNSAAGIKDRGRFALVPSSLALPALEKDCGGGRGATVMISFVINRWIINEFEKLKLIVDGKNINSQRPLINLKFYVNFISRDENGLKVSVQGIIVWDYFDQTFPYF